MTEKAKNTFENWTRYTPPLGHSILTPLYDFAIAALTRENTWRAALIAAIQPEPGDRILDIGSGTGSLAARLYEECPLIRYVGIDPDADSVRRAQRKASKLSGKIQFQEGFFSTSEDYFDQAPNKIVSSLVLHQVSLIEKRRIIMEAIAALAPGGSLFIADYGLQKGLMRFFFRVSVQLLDGISNTQPNADGFIEHLIEEARLVNERERDCVPTVTGLISIFKLTKSNII